MRLIRLLKNELAREAADWVDRSIISEAQAEQICEQYDVDYHQQNNSSRGYRVLLGLAYLFVGLALITVLGANWDNIPRELRMAGLIALTLGTQALGARKFSAGDRNGGIGLFFLGNFFFGAAIILIAQIYHLGEHMPDGIFLWAMGGLPFALITLSPLLMLQTMVLAMTWFFVESGMGFYPAAFPVFLMSSLFVLRRGSVSVSLLAAAVFGVGLWFEYSLSEWWREGRHFYFGAEHLAVSIGLFLALYAFGYWLYRHEASKARDYGSVLVLWSLRLGLLFMLVLSFIDPWESLIDASWDHQVSVLALATTLSALTLWLSWRSGTVSQFAILVGLYLTTLLLVMASSSADAAVYFQLAYNLILIGLGLTLILGGVHSGSSEIFFLGVATILLTAFVRYVDLIGDYVGGALLFLILAALMFGAATYWRRQQAKEAQA